MSGNYRSIRKYIFSWPFAFWLLVVFITFVFFMRHTRYRDITGVVENMSQSVSVLQAARLKTVNVIVGQKVKKGDVLATLDSAVVDAEIAVVNAELKEEETSIRGFQGNMLSLARRFRDAVSIAEADLNSEKMKMNAVAAELAELKKEQSRRNELLKNKIINEQTAYALKPRIVSLESMLKSYPDILKVYKDRLQRAKDDSAELKRWLKIKDSNELSDAIKQKLSARLDTLNAKRDLLLAKKESFILRAARDGQVARVQRMAGDVVARGEPIVRIICDKPEYVMGFLPEKNLYDMHEGETVIITRYVDSPAIIKGVVESIAPEVRTLNGMNSAFRSRPVRARTVMIRVDKDSGLLPGEAVRISHALPMTGIFERVSHLFSK